MRYNTFVYDTGVLYDSGPFDAQLWLLQVDWDGDGEYEDENEAERMISCWVVRGRRHLINSTGDGFEPVAPGLLAIRLDNDDGRFDPYNTESPLYPYVRPGVKIQLLTRLPGGDVRRLFAGQISDIQPISGKPSWVHITAVDGMRIIREQEIVIPTQETISVDSALGMILDAVEWPWGRSLDVSPDVIRWFWARPETTAEGAITKLMDGSLGTFFVAADGSAKFYDRNRMEPAVISIDQAQMLKDISFRQPWDVVRNQVTAIAHPREAQNSADLWRLFDKPSVAAGASIELWAAFSYEGETVPVASYVPLEAGVDYLVNTLSNGTGTDLTGDCSVAMTVFSTTAKIILENNSLSNGYITLFKVRGNALTSRTVKVSRADLASRALYGAKSIQIDSIYLQDSNLTGGIADMLLQQLSDPQLFPVVQLEHQPGLQFEADLFDNVDLIIPHAGLIGTYRLAYIEHKWLDSTGLAVHTVYGFEPVSTLATDVWRFPTEIGITSKFAF